MINVAEKIPRSFSSMNCLLADIAPAVVLAGLLLSPYKLLVLLGDEPPEDYQHDNGTSTRGDDSASTRFISRLLVSEEEIGSEPMGDVAHAIGNSNQRSSFRTGSGNDCRLPRQLEIKGDEGTAAEQKEAEVPRRLVQSRNHDNGTNESDHHGRHHVPKIFQNPSAGP